MNVVEIETENLLAASPGIDEEGNATLDGIALTDEQKNGRAKGYELWDFDEE